ncbi:uncharacterized protein LOC125901166 [Epinephelus fuscoguttatus]|uniref:uncharacterized protein LOC125901166 n=1 Tax=Epinephelus fuscoguttatus TaxID=293821 RepID=UPI0020D1C131|nr:uncharacterized protein LOC125901166 [Epinephelus fuscoguttatus]
MLTVFHTGLNDGSDVTQTDILWEKQGDNATMQCSHTKGVQHYQMYWYRQLPGETMKLIVYTQLGMSRSSFFTSDPMYWYRQLPGETMKLIVFTRIASEDHDFGDVNKMKFAATKPDAESGTFTVKNLEPEDKGLYFCAVSQHSASHSKSVFQTPPFIMKKTGQSVAREINCSHSITNYDVILWYKQDQHKALKLLGYLNISLMSIQKLSFISLQRDNMLSLSNTCRKPPSKMSL